MKHIVDFIREVTLAHPFWIIAACLTIGFFMGLMLIVSIAQMGQEKENVKHSQMRKFFKQNNKKL